MLRVVVLVSGGGTNLQAILDGIDKGIIKDTKVVGVISNNKNAYALLRAQEKGIYNICIAPKEYDSRATFNEVFLKEVNRLEPDLIVLAGFLVVVPDLMIKKYRNRIINIHPSLIPAFSGRGFYGLKVHEAAIERGVKIVGATVHFVDEGTDTGPIIMQKAVNVREDDTPETLQKRVMVEGEQVILPQVIALFAENKVQVERNKVVIRP